MMGGRRFVWNVQLLILSSLVCSVKVEERVSQAQERGMSLSRRPVGMHVCRAHVEPMALFSPESCWCGRPYDLVVTT